jgi:hypothetical protein
MLSKCRQTIKSSRVNVFSRLFAHTDTHNESADEAKGSENWEIQLTILETLWRIQLNPSVVEALESSVSGAEEISPLNRRSESLMVQQRR